MNTCSEQYITNFDRIKCSDQSLCSSLTSFIILFLADKRVTSIASLAVPCITPPPSPPDEAI